MIDDNVVLKVVNLKQHFKTGVGRYRMYNKAVDGVSFEVKKGEVFSLVGESGCGKTTTGRTIIKIYKPTDGEVFLLGKRIVAGTLGYYDEIKELKKALKEKKIELKKSDKSSNVAQEELSELKKTTKARIKEIKELIKEANVDQKTKYLPDEKIVDDIKAKASVEIEKYKKLIKEEEASFAKFKATAFSKSDSFNASSESATKEEIHAEEIKLYRERRRAKNLKIEEYQSLIIKEQTSPKFFNRPLLNKMQMIFQDPIDSLDPRMSVKDIIAESLYINGIKNDRIVLEKVYEVLKIVGLQPEHADHYPHEFSGGQRQRIGIARAIISEPQIIIADEPISALDVSIQAQVINLLNDLRMKLGLTILFIAHDLSVVKFLSDRIGIMYYGKIVEIGSKEKVFNNPLHPYTLSLITSIPMPDPDYERARGDSKRYNPGIHDYSVDKPTMREIEPDHFVLANDAEFAKYQKVIKNNKQK